MIKGGLFRPGSGDSQPVGEINLKHCCILSLGKRKHEDDVSETGEPEVKHKKGIYQ